MKLHRRLSILILLAAIFLAACGGAPATPPPQYDIILTEGVKTMVASYFETQTALAPTATATVPTPTITQTLPSTPVGFLSNVLTPTLTPTLVWIPVVNTATPIGTVVTGTVNPGSLAAGCNNLEVLSDASISPGDSLQPGGDFTVTWDVRNTGSCTWAGNYHLVQTGGPDFDMVGGYADRNIPAGNKGTVTVHLQAPNKNGGVTGSFRMADGDGTPFGQTMTVTITVGG